MNGNATIQSRERESYPVSRVRIRFQDCDPLGHLNNARYLDYFLSEREEQLLRYYDVDLREAGRRGRVWVVRNSSLSHLTPVFYGDTVSIRTSLIGYTKAGITMEGLMFGETEADIHAACWIEFAYIDLEKQRPARHEERYMALFERIKVESDYNFQMNRLRMRNLRQEAAHPAAKTKKPGL